MRDAEGGIAAAAASSEHRLLVEAVREAGAIALRYFEEGGASWEKRPGHLVGEADLAVDRFLRQTLLAARPEYGWLSEEHDDDLARLGRARVFVVDPIDGTRSFLRHQPEFAISAALIEAGCPIAGCVFNPATDELFEAEAGRGARGNGEALEVSARGELKGATLLSGHTELARKLWCERFPESTIEPISSIAYKLALVASGRFDALISLWPKHDWDLAAGALLVEEAGGRVSAADGAALCFNQRSARVPHVVASNGRLHAALIARLAAATRGET